jgi:hypothetical protein
MRDHSNPSSLVPALALAIVLTSCSAKEETAPSSSQILVQEIADAQILVDLAALTKATRTLDKHAADFCEDPSGDGLTRLQKDWKKSANLWYRVQLFNFGPADVDPVLPLYSFIDSLRPRGTIYTDSARLSQASWVDSAEELSEEFFQEQRFDDVGLVSLEVSLFDDEDLLTQYEDEARKCEVLLGLTGELNNRAEELLSGWAEDFDGSGVGFYELLQERKLPNGRYPLVEIILSAQAYADYLHKRHVVTVAGQLSQTGWDLMTAAVQAIDDLLAQELEGGNIFYYMGKLGDPASVSKVQADLEAAHNAIEEQDVEALEAALILIDGDFKREIPDALGIELGLNLTDGD